MKKTVIWLLIIYFFFIGFIIFPKDDRNLYENRSLSEKPSISLESLLDGNFQAEFEVYIDDHLPFRSHLIVVRKTLEDIVTPNHSLTFPRYNEDDIEKVIKVYNEICQSVDVPLFIQVIPQKGFINVQENKYLGENYLSQQIKTFNELGLKIENCSNYQFREDLIKEENYFKYDHHWNNVGITKWYDKLEFPSGIEKVNLKEIEKQEYENYLFGGTVRTSPITNNGKEDFYIYNFDNTGISCVQNGKDVNYIKKELIEEESYVTSTYNYYATVDYCKNTNALNEESILFISDSFSQWSYPILIQQFSEVYLYNYRKDNEEDVLELSKNVDYIMVLFSSSHFQQANELNLFIEEKK